MRLGIAIASACLALSVAAPADAAITSVFENTPTPVPCAVQPNGVRLCSQAASGAPRSTVHTFDSVPIDVTVAFPPAPSSGADGPYPLLMMFHGYGGTKFPLARMQPWLDHGFATFTMTARGFGESCGSAASRAADPVGCANGYIRLLDTRYEVRDAQQLSGLLYDEGHVDGSRVGATGRSYGGALSLALAALGDREMLPDGSLVPWTSPAGQPMRIAAAAPEIPWSDLAAALAPNGSTLDYVADAPYRGPTGVLKQSWENSLYAAGLPYFYPAPGADPDADFPGWHATMNAGEPYDDTSGDPLPPIADLRDELTTHHSAYYIDDSQPPAPLLISNGFTDDLFPPDEAIRFYNRTRTLYPDNPISLFFSSSGHRRAQNKLPDAAALAATEQAWMDYYVRGVGAAPSRGVQALTQTCPDSAPSGGPYVADTWADVAPGEVTIGGGAQQKIDPDAGSAAIGTAFDPMSGGGACATAPAADQTGTATYRGAPVPAGGYTLLGSPTVIADFTSTTAGSQIAARLLDVDPATDSETLVARGLWRPAAGGRPEHQVFQLHPNGYRFAAGHIVKLELLPEDSPYGRISNGQATIRVAHLWLRLPVAESPGSLGGLVRDPAPKVVPPGFTLARDFVPPASYARPMGAGPFHASLVPAFSPCSSPSENHGAPLSFGSCANPRQVSPDVTIGTQDTNGLESNSVGMVHLDVVRGDPSTPADEADVVVRASVTDVRDTLNLSDYTGELEGRLSVRITDQATGSGADEAGTVEDTPLSVAIPCGETPDPTSGGYCGVLTTVDAQIPGAVGEGRRSIWELGDVQVFDGGSDGLAATHDGNSLFARQGLFVP